MYWEAQKCLDGGGTVKTDFWHEHRRCNREKKVFTTQFAPN